MQTKKFWTLMNVLALVLCTFITFSSCSKDDENATASIVGTWTCNSHYYGGSDTYTFKSNGTYSWSYSGSADWFPDDSGNYSFDNNRSTLTIHNKKGTTWVYIVMSLTSSSLTIMDEDGHTYYYTK